MGAPPLVYTGAMLTPLDCLPFSRRPAPGRLLGTGWFLAAATWAVATVSSPRLDDLLPAGARFLVGTAAYADPGATGTAGPPGSVAQPYLDLEEGKAAARSAKKPLLVLFRTADCAFSDLFFQRTATDPEVAAVLPGLVFTTIDGSAGKGSFLARIHEVTVTPTFVLYDPDRGPLHQWKGWGQPAFLTNLVSGLRADTPVVDRLARFETAPTAEDAALLGFFHASTGAYATALTEFETAERLDAARDYASEKFDAAAAGYFAGEVSLDRLRAAADGVVTKTAEAEEAVNIASIMARVTERAGQGALAAPYLRNAMEKSAGSSDPGIHAVMDRLEPYRLLYVENDPGAALARYQEGYRGWPSDPDALNNVAWWCQAHGIHLVEAEGWAREAVAAYADPRDRANARDTLANLLLRRGDREGAIEQLTKAFEEAPEVTAYGLALRDLGAEVELPESEGGSSGGSR